MWCLNLIQIKNSFTVPLFTFQVHKSHLCPVATILTSEKEYSLHHKIVLNSTDLEEETRSNIGKMWYLIKYYGRVSVRYSKMTVLLYYMCSSNSLCHAVSCNKNSLWGNVVRGTYPKTS